MASPRLWTSISMRCSTWPTRSSSAGRRSPGCLRHARRLAGATAGSDKVKSAPTCRQSGLVPLARRRRTPSWRRGGCSGAGREASRLVEVASGRHVARRRGATVHGRLTSSRRTEVRRRLAGYTAAGSARLPAQAVPAREGIPAPYQRRLAQREPRCGRDGSGVLGRAMAATHGRRVSWHRAGDPLVGPRACYTSGFAAGVLT